MELHYLIYHTGLPVTIPLVLILSALIAQAVRETIATVDADK